MFNPEQSRMLTKIILSAFDRYADKEGYITEQSLIEEMMNFGFSKEDAEDFIEGMYQQQILCWEYDGNDKWNEEIVRIVEPDKINIFTLTTPN